MSSFSLFITPLFLNRTANVTTILANGDQVSQAIVIKVALNQLYEALQLRCSY